MNLGLALLHRHRRAVHRRRELGDALLEGGDLVLQFDDALDAGEVDALVLRPCCTVRSSSMSRAE